MIAVIDYGMGNLRSVQKAFEFLGFEAVVTDDTAVMEKADKLVLPGVGAFGDAMEKLTERGLPEALREAVRRNIPFLGICLGLQLFFERSDESENNVEGLGLLPGEIVRFPAKDGYKIPHMGWNSIHINPKSRLLHGISQDSYVYFVHSYYLRAQRKEDVAASTDYIVEVHAAVERDNVFATQFHPEKSGEVGLQILKNFVSIS